MIHVREVKNCCYGVVFLLSGLLIVACEDKTTAPVIFEHPVSLISTDLIFPLQEIILSFNQTITYYNEDNIHLVKMGSGRMNKNSYTIRTEFGKLVIRLGNLPLADERFRVEIASGGLRNLAGALLQKPIETPFVPPISEEEFRIEDSYPQNYSNNYDISKPLTFAFSEKFTLEPGAQIRLEGYRLDFFSYDSFSFYTDSRIFNESDLLIKEEQKTIEIPLNPKSQQDNLRNLDLNYGYLVRFSGFKSLETGKVFEGRIDFKVADLEHRKVWREASEFDPVNTPINWKSKSNYHLSRFNENRELTHYEYAGKKGYTGEKIRVGVLDTGIAQETNVHKAVVYSFINLPSELLLDYDAEIQYNHGTQMARYMLTFAPDIYVYDLFKEYVLFNSRIPDIAEEFPRLDMDIISSSGSGIKRDYSLYRDMIQNGLVVNVSVGNDSWYLYTSGALEGTESSYKHREKFFPYIYNLSESLGAFVVVGSTGRYYTPPGEDEVFYDWRPGMKTPPIEETEPGRSPLGELRYFAVSLQEDGQGATSQTTALFSGLLAVLMEANRELEAGFTPKELVRTVFETASDIGAKGVDSNFGWGIPNLEEVIKRLENGVKPKLADPYADLDSEISKFMETAPNGPVGD